MKISLAITGVFLAVFLLNLSSAVGPVGESGFDVYVVNNTIIIEGYTVVGIQQYNAITGQYTTTAQKFVSNTNSLLINRVNESVGGTINCNSVNITEGNFTNTYFANCTMNINYHREVPLLNFAVNNTNQSQPTVTDSATQDKYEKCLEEKAAFSTGMSTCIQDKKNLADFSANFTTCNTDLIQCRSEKSSVDGEKTRLQTEAEEKKNQRWTYFIAGLALAGLGVAWYAGLIGGNKLRRPEEKYNIHQSG